MLDKAPRQNISLQHLQISFQVRFKALVVILYNFCLKARTLTAAVFNKLTLQNELLYVYL